jgi:hypothetical protein
MRLIELADIEYESPTGLHRGRARTPRPWNEADRSVLYVVDPVTKVYGQVLDADGAEAFAARIAEDGTSDSSLQSVFTRRTLHQALSAPVPPQRAVFVGHVTRAADDPGATSLVLSDDHRTFGVMATLGGVNRPLSALDLLEGTQNSQARLRYLAREKLDRDRVTWPTEHQDATAGADIWPMPSRIALIACNSGSDLRNGEPFGLALALINAGAEVVTATKWTLPTDTALESFAGVEGHRLVDMALSVDDAHVTDDPVAAIASWQRARLAEWEADGGMAASPVLWAALSTYMGDSREVTEDDGPENAETPWRTADERRDRR